MHLKRYRYRAAAILSLIAGIYGFVIGYQRNDWFQLIMSVLLLVLAWASWGRDA